VPGSSCDAVAGTMIDGSTGSVSGANELVDVLVIIVVGGGGDLFVVVAVVARAVVGNGVVDVALGAGAVLALVVAVVFVAAGAGVVIVAKTSVDAIRLCMRVVCVTQQSLPAVQSLRCTDIGVNGTSRKEKSLYGESRRSNKIGSNEFFGLFRYVALSVFLSCVSKTLLIHNLVNTQQVDCE
jgi:hypothetical protein